ncbi:protein of unknown function [Tenacibaculum sp. 190130A14a]|uniref:Uncharacterized protein n=1 Tax=Tenacibaculum polynesiense TaxID=3137857 RepID=A0ABM9PFF9_9FLAO
MGKNYVNSFLKNNRIKVVLILLFVFYIQPFCTQLALGSTYNLGIVELQLTEFNPRNINNEEKILWNVKVVNSCLPMLKGKQPFNVVKLNVTEDLLLGHIYNKNFSMPLEINVVSGKKILKLKNFKDKKELATDVVCNSEVQINTIDFSKGNQLNMDSLPNNGN